MKRVLFLVATLLSVSILQAKVIKPNDAMTFAKTFCEKVVSQPEAMNQNWKLAYTECSAKDKEVNAVYVFNKPQNNGFVVIAADDIVPNVVLGYSDNGVFDYNKMPDGLKWLLSMYSKQIDNLKAQGKNYANAQSTATKDSIIIPPLMGNVLWEQGDPYNRLCPAGCPVGCVATATTALMYFHKWPLTGTGSKTYKEHGRTHTVNFSKSNYQWQNILPRYNGSFTTAQADAISKLSFDCGVSVEMDYTSSGSGAHNNDVKTALTTYFKYNSDVEYKKCRAMTRDDWNTILKNELNAMRPLLYGGQGSFGGHAFICDGYTKNEYFHFNFGWSGSGNGYYLSSLDDQTAKESEADFSIGQDIVYNLHPDNKHFVDGLYYHILSADEVEVCAPESSVDYTGNIIIPNIVRINDKEYKVTRIGCAAFGNCKEITSLTLSESIEVIEGNCAFGCIKLDSLFVPWSEPLEVYSNTFYNDLTSKTVLVVPAGSIKSYSAAEGWNQFAKIADGQTSNAEWTEWKPFESGYCKYVQNSMFKTTYNLNIYQRALVSDMTKVQLKVKDFGQFSALDLIINWDKQTNECQVEKQNYGYYDDKYGDSYVSDMPHYQSYYTYKSYPCKFNPETGIFELYLVYFCDQGIYGHATDNLIPVEAPKPEWTEWAKCGTAEYTHGFYNDGDGEGLQEDIVVYKRTYISNPEIFEYKFEGWGTGYWSESGTDIIVHINADGTITINEQYTGYNEVDRSTGEELPVYVMDAVSFNSNTFTPKYCSSTFDSATKTGNIWPLYFWYPDPESSSVTGYFGIYPNSAGGFDKRFCDTFVIHEATGGLKGDANDDGSVNVNDISTIAAYILEDSPQPFVFENADVNDDGVVNVNDISATATIILDGEGGGKASGVFNLDPSKLAYYWYKHNSHREAGKDEARINVPSPEDGMSTIATPFETILASTFVGNKIDAESMLTVTDPTSDKAFAKSKLIYDLVFDVSNVNKEFKGMSGTTYQLSVDATGKELYADIKDVNDVKQIVAKLEIRDLAKAASVNNIKLAYQHSDYAHDLLNVQKYDEMTDDMILVVIAIKVKNECGMELPVTGNTFNERFVRPINVENINAEITDDRDAQQVVNLKDLVKLFDWRGYKFADHTSYIDYWAYYNIKSITVRGASAGSIINGLITTDMDGGTLGSTILSTKSDLVEFKYNPVTPAAPSATANYGTIVYTNYGNNVVKFNVQIPIRVTYEWGHIDTYVTIKVNGTRQGAK